MTENIISVSEADFEYEVIAYSQNTPVIVDFWADWCRPCKQLSPLLEKLTQEANGAFRLARVDVDVNPNLALRCKVRSLPTVVAFSGGNQVADFAGLQPEGRVREFISQILPPSPANLSVEKGASLLAVQKLEQAEKAYQEALAIDAKSPGALLGLMKIHLLRGNSEAANQILRIFPACREYNEAEILLPLIRAMNDLKANLLPKETDLDAAFENSIRLAVKGNIFASLDGLMDILRQEKHFRRDRARVVALALLELTDPQGTQTLQYRKELTTILF
ncbi:MAG: tetratricopeptide repeat protein [Anaerolineaceae bacterium]